MNSLFRLAIRPAAGLPMLIASHSELSILNFRDRMGLAVIFWIVEILFSQTHVFFFLPEESKSGIHHIDHNQRASAIQQQQPGLNQLAT